MAHQITGHAPFAPATQPFTKRMSFASLLRTLVKLVTTTDKPKRKKQYDPLSAMSHADLADLGLQRKFNGMTWYVDRISNELPARKNP